MLSLVAGDDVKYVLTSGGDFRGIGFENFSNRAFRDRCCDKDSDFVIIFSSRSLMTFVLVHSNILFKFCLPHFKPV